MARTPLEVAQETVHQWWQTLPSRGALNAVFHADQITQAHYAAIGRVAAAWALFEVSVDLWLADFAGVPAEVAVCFTGQLNGPRSRVDAFIAMAKHFGAEKSWNEPLDKFAKNVQSLGEMRNRVVHDVWELSNAHEPLRVERSARQKVRLLSVHVPTSELLKLEANINDLMVQFNVMAGTLFGQLHGLRDTSPEGTAP